MFSQKTAFLSDELQKKKVGAPPMAAHIVHHSVPKYAERLYVYCLAQIVLIPEAPYFGSFSASPNQQSLDCF